MASSTGLLWRRCDREGGCTAPLFLLVCIDWGLCGQGGEQASPKAKGADCATPCRSSQKFKGLDMNRHEIDNMMRDLPSQHDYYHEEPLWEKCIMGFLFIAFVVTICFI